MTRNAFAIVVVALVVVIVSALDGCRLIAHDIACETNANCPPEYATCSNGTCIANVAGEGEGEGATSEGEGEGSSEGEGEGTSEGEGEGSSEGEGEGAGEGEGEGAGEGEGEGEGAVVELGDVQPVAPQFAPWLSWFANGTGNACNAADTNCVLVGPIRGVVLPASFTTCAGLSGDDDLRVFDWTCFNAGGQIAFQSQLKPGKGLDDLLETDGAGGFRFKPNRVVITNASGVVAESNAGVWWPDVVVALADAQASVPPGTIGVVAGRRTFPLTLAPNTGLVVLTSAGAEVDGAGGVSALAGNNIDFAYVEGTFFSDDVVAVNLQGCRHIALQHVHLESLAAGLLVASGIQVVVDDAQVFLGTGGTAATSGVQISNGQGHALSNVVVANATTLGVLLSATTNASLNGVRVVGMGFGAGTSDPTRRGIELSQTTHASLVDVMVVSGDGVGVSLEQGSNDNALAGVTVGMMTGNGVQLVDSNRNTAQSVATVNVPIGVAVVGPSQDNLIVDVVLEGDTAMSFTSDSFGAPSQNSVQGIFEHAPSCVGGSGQPVNGLCQGPANGVLIDASTPLVVGYVAVESTNPAGAVKPAAQIVDFTDFDRATRAWAIDGSDVTASAARGPCANACHVVDWASAPAGPLEAGRALPANPDFSLNDGTTHLHVVAGLAELGGDGDLVCDGPSDFCLELVHIGGFQGEGPLDIVGTATTGALVGAFANPD